MIRTPLGSSWYGPGYFDRSLLPLRSNRLPDGLSPGAWEYAPPGNTPRPILAMTPDDMREVVGIFDNKAHPDHKLYDILARAEETVVSYLGLPISKRSFINRYRMFDRRMWLSVRRIGSEALGPITTPAMTAINEDGDSVDVEGYIVDSTGEAPALIIETVPEQNLHKLMEYPVTVRFDYEPIVPMRVTAALERGVKAYFDSRNSGSPYGEKMMQDEVRMALSNLMPPDTGHSLVY